MSKFSKIAAVFAVLPVLVLAGTAFAGSPGQLGGGNTYQVKNLTQNGSYASTISATCNDEIEYSMELGNTGYGTLTDVTLKATLPSAGGTSTATATTDQGGTTGASDNVTVNLSASSSSSNAVQTLENGTTVLYDGNGNAIKTLSDTITTTGVNIGTLNGSTTEFVNFKAKVSCSTPTCPSGTTGTYPNCEKPPVTPPATTTTPPATPAAPTALVNTGAGDVVGLFAVAVAAGTIGYRVYLGRRLSRQ